MKVLLVVPGKKGFSTEGFQSLGIGMIAAMLLQAGHDVKVLDLTVNRLNLREFGIQVQQYNPDLIGFTIVTPTADVVYHELVPEAYKNSQAEIVVGGPHPTALPDEALQYVDYVVRGEGEGAIVELCDDTFKKQHVKNLSFKVNGQNFHNPSRALIKDLDSLPFPARHLFPPLQQYKGLPSLGKKVVGNLASSRGCASNCKFCDKAVFGRVFRPRSAENVVDEWETLIKKYEAEAITISDDNFTSSPTRVKKVCTLLKHKQLHHIPWTCSNGIRVETASYELLSLMKKAGCCAVAFGIESGSQEVLDAMNKGITVEKIQWAVRNAREAGIQTISGFFMLGTPWDTVQTMEETIRFAKNLPLDYAQFSIAVPYPGTVMYEEVKNALIGTSYKNYGAHEGVVYFSTEALQPEVVEKYFHKAYKAFYMRPSLMFRHLKRIILYPSTMLAYLDGAKRFIIK